VTRSNVQTFNTLPFNPNAFRLAKRCESQTRAPKTKPLRVTDPRSGGLRMCFD